MNPISLQTYRSLPDQMFSREAPVATRDPRLLHLNTGLLHEYGLDETWFRSSEGLRRA